MTGGKESGEKGNLALGKMGIVRKIKNFKPKEPLLYLPLDILAFIFPQMLFKSAVRNCGKRKSGLTLSIR